VENRRRQDCDGSRPKQGGQASDQASKRAPDRHRPLRPDTSLERHPRAGSSSHRVTGEEHRHQPDNSPRRDRDTLTVLSPEVACCVVAAIVGFAGCSRSDRARRLRWIEEDVDAGDGRDLVHSTAKQVSNGVREGEPETSPLAQRIPDFQGKRVGGVGFEPTGRLRAQRLSRPLRLALSAQGHRRRSCRSERGKKGVSPPQSVSRRLSEEANTGTGAPTFPLNQALLRAKARSVPALCRARFPVS
jgi:hypothetical protein